MVTTSFVDMPRTVFFHYIVSIEHIQSRLSVCGEISDALMKIQPVPCFPVPDISHEIFIPGSEPRTTMRLQDWDIDETYLRGSIRAPEQM